MLGTSCPLAIVTGASSGIGLELARLALAQGYDLIIAADEPEIHDVAGTLATDGAEVRAVQADLATMEGEDELYEAAREAGRPVELLVANAGRGLGHAFLDQKFEEAKRVVDTNIVGTIYGFGRDAAEIAFASSFGEMEADQARSIMRMVRPSSRGARQVRSRQKS